MNENYINITIDGMAIKADPKKTVLTTALENGIKIPYFCHFVDLLPDGNCRMCLIEIEKQRKLQVSCITYPTEGMVVFTKTQKVLDARKSVLELILRDHPLDCPICDKVGECELQENFFQFSGQPSHLIDPALKHKAPKLVKLSDRIIYDTERCIKCSRCQRFCEQVSKTYDLSLVGRGHHSHVAVTSAFKNNKYSDCVSDVCPVGSLTTTGFRFKARVYELTKTPSVCALCSRGCNIFVEHKRGDLYRVMPRRNLEINKSWICNAGRDLYQYTDRARSKPLYKGETTPYLDAKNKFKEIIQEHKNKGSRILAVASSFGSNEEIDLFMNVFKGAKTFYKVDSFMNQKEYPQDDILIRDDKNPNIFKLKASGLSEIKASDVAEDYDLLVVWGEGFKISEAFKKAKLKILITPFEDENKNSYDLVLPTPIYVEKGGSFTNFEGKVSKFYPAYNKYPELRNEKELFEGIK